MDELDIIYNSRRNEFVKLLNSSHSRTSHNLITEAINITDENFQLFTDLSYHLFEYLTKLTQEKKDKIDKYNEQFDIFKRNLNQVPLINASKQQKDILIAYYQVNLELFESMTTMDKNVNNLLTSATQFAGQEVRITLFEYIFKPNQSDFKLDIIIDIVLSIADKFIPYLGDTRTIVNLAKKTQKKSYLKEGDKLFQYLEKYIDASRLWKQLVISFNENGLK